MAYPVNIVGDQVTAGVDEETLLLSINGTTPLDSFLVRTGVKVVFDSLVYAADAQAIFILQKSVDNGANWFAVNTWNRPQSGSDMISQGSLISVEGGPQVRARVRVKTPGGAARVSTSMHGTFQAA